METFAKCLDDREYIKWNNKYCVGISIIDEQHKKLFGFINKTIYAMEHSDSTEDLTEELKEVLEEMINFAQEHFETEDNYMIEFDYPEFEEHNEEHYDFLTKTIAYFGRVVNGDYHISNKLIKYLKQWLVNHIQVSDKKYVNYSNLNSLKYSAQN